MTRLRQTAESTSPAREAQIEDAFTIVIYGLSGDGEAVRADVFAHKISALVKALQAADRLANGRKRHRFVIDGLEKHSALTQIKGHSTTRRPVKPASLFLGKAFSAVCNGGYDASYMTPQLVSLIEKMSYGAEETFSHAEVFHSRDNIVRIDKFFIRQLNSVRRDMREMVTEDSALNFEGSSIETFDGSLRVVDERGEMIKALLELTVGRKSIECVVRKNLLDDVLSKFGKRARVSGKATYDHSSLLPQRIEVNSIEIIPGGDLLSSWKGKFRIPQDSDAWSDE